MKPFKRLFHFLGGVYFAISLIGLLATTTIVGTFLEAYTDSHLYAAQWTYGHPFFGLLLCLFFINILFSTLRRWPFKSRHIPFLITHLGLLMIIGGTILKNQFGVQGHLPLMEGSANQSVSLPYTHALQIEKKDANHPDRLLSLNYPLELDSTSHSHPFLEGVEWKIVHHAPHVVEKWRAWIKGPWAYIKGAPPIPVQDWTGSTPLQVSFQHPLRSDDEETKWTIIAVRTDRMQEAIEQAYKQGLFVKYSLSGQTPDSLSVSLEKALQETIQFDRHSIDTQLQLPFSIVNGFEEPKLIVELADQDQKETIRVPLTGESALLPLVTSPNWKNRPSLSIDLIREPTLLLIEDSQGDSHVFAFDPYGRVFAQSFRQADLQTLIVYDQGFGGYSAQVDIPFPACPCGRKDKEKAELDKLAKQIDPAIQAAPLLIPPIQLFKQACQQTNQDIGSAFLAFLYRWRQNGSFLYPIDQPLEASFDALFSQLEWKAIPASHKQGCLWISQLFDQLEKPLREGENPLVFLKKNKWPFVKELERQQAEDATASFAHLLARQIFEISPQLPALKEKETESAVYSAHLLSAYLSAFGIDYDSLRQTPAPNKEETFDDLIAYYTNDRHRPPSSFVLETPLTVHHKQEKPFVKLEDNTPSVLLEWKQGDKKQYAAFSYDRFETGLKRPVLNGAYKVRFQPRSIKIPYRVRLRQARQINYANSSQPYSYEADLIIVGPDGKPIEKTLSMNHVHETWDGYRFYLAGMTTTEDGIKRVQLVVNRDPAKYYLTYPGSLIVALGIVLLFWMRPYSKKKS